MMEGKQEERKFNRKRH